MKSELCLVIYTCELSGQQCITIHGNKNNKFMFQNFNTVD